MAAPAATDLPPWIEHDAAPMAGSLRRRRAATAGRAECEAVHWSVVLLTLFTAACVLLGAFGGEPRPKELLPIIITVAG